MATNVGEAVIKLIFDDEESIKKATKAFENFGSFAKSAGKVAASGIAATSTAVAGLAAGSVKLYANYEQLQGGIETLFKDSSDTIMTYAQDAYKTAGLSAAEYMEQATNFSSRLIRDTGGDTQRAAELVDLAIKDMSDNANKMGTDIESIQNAYAGLSKGNATMLDNLKVGYGGTQTEMLKLAKDMGVIDENVKSFNDISFEDSILAIHKVQEQLGITGTTAQEAQSTISGSFNMMNKSWKDLVTGFANPNADVGQLIDNLVGSIESMADNLVPAVDQALKGISIFIKKAVPKLLDIIPDLLTDIIPDIIDTGVELFNQIMDYIPEVTQMLLDLFFQILDVLIPQLPTILKAVIDGILGFLVTLAQPQNVTMLLNAAVQLLFAIIEAIPILLEALATALPDIIASLITFFTDPNNIMLLI